MPPRAIRLLLHDQPVPQLAVHARDEEHEAAALLGGVDGASLGVPLDREGDGHVREDDDVVHGEDWE